MDADALGVLGHELRAPLTGILGLVTYVLDEEAALPDGVRDKLALVQDDAGYLLGMLDGLLLSMRGTVGAPAEEFRVLEPLRVLDRLLACGEAACTGLHGANRLASNSLLEGLVFGARSAHAALECLQDSASNGKPPRIISDIPLSQRSELDLSDVRSSLRSVLWRHVGIERSGDRLVEVGEMCDFWARYTLDKIFDDLTGWQIQNMLLAGALITRSASWRKESRGTHFRSDFPEQRGEFHQHDLWQRGWTEPVIEAVK